MKLKHIKESSSRTTTMPSYQNVRREGVKFVRDNLANYNLSHETLLLLINRYLSLPRNDFLPENLKDSLKKDLLDAFL